MKTTMTRRYYMGSKSISNSDGRSPALKLLTEAIDDASKAVEDGEVEIAYVVEVVRVVRRAKILIPISIEETR